MSLETLSPEEDNGEDPCQSIRPPSDDRERMLHLETAVTWIKQQVVRFLMSTFFWGVVASLGSRMVFFFFLCCVVGVGGSSPSGEGNIPYSYSDKLQQFARLAC